MENYEWIFNYSNKEEKREVNSPAQQWLNRNYPKNQRWTIEKLDIRNNCFSGENLGFLSHLVNLKDLRLGNNNFVGSLEPLKDMTELEYLDIINSDINKGVDYLPNRLRGTDRYGKKKVHYSTKESEVKQAEELQKDNNKIKEIIWQLDLFTSGTQGCWENLGFTTGEIKKWLDAGLKTNEYNFADYLKNEKVLEPQKIGNELIKLRNEYNATVDWWSRIASRNSAPGLRKKWIKKGFTDEQAWEWTSYPALLSPQESDLAKYLHDKKITPVEIKDYINGLREEYEKFKNSDSDINAEIESDKKVAIGRSNEIAGWENIHPLFKRKSCQNQWKEVGFDHQQTKKWIDKGLKPDHFGFAHYLKSKGYDSSQLLISDLIKLKKKYQNPQTYLEFFHPTKEITKLKLENKDLNGNLTINGWVNLEELLCSIHNNIVKNKLPHITLNDLPKLRVLIAQDCETTKLTIVDCPNLQKIDVSNNSLSGLDFLRSLSSEKLTSLAIGGNNFPVQSVKNLYSSFLNKFKNLEELRLGDIEYLLQLEKNSQLYGSLEPLRNLNKLRELDISGTDIDQGLEYLPDDLEIIRCADLWSSEKNFACSKIGQELQDYYLQKGLSYNPRAWKENQKFFELLRENLKKVNPGLTDVCEFFHQQNVFFNTRTNEFQGNLQSFLTCFANLNNLLIRQKEIENFFFESQIQELKNLIKNQKEKIVNAYLYLSTEKELLKELVTAHLEFTKFKSRAFNSSDYDEQCEEYEENCRNLKKQLRSKLSKEEMNEIRRILTDCEELIKWELELEEKLQDKSKLIEGQRGFLPITEKEYEQLQVSMFQEHYWKNQLNKVEELVNQQNQFSAEKTGLTTRFKRALSITSQTIPSSKQIRLDNEPESMEIDKINIQNRDWTNIHPNFTEELKQKWQDFSYQQTQEWINIGLQPTDYELVFWLKNIKQLTPEKVLNKYDVNNLKNEFIKSQQTAQIQQNNLPFRNNQ